jgi:hypothetical protein
VSTDTAQFHESYNFKLADSFTGDTKFFADFEKGAAATITNPVAEGDDGAFARGEQGERSMQFFAKEVLGGGLGGCRSSTVFEGVGE